MKSIHKLAKKYPDKTYMELESLKRQAEQASTLDTFCPENPTCSTCQCKFDLDKEVMDFYNEKEKK